MQSLERSLTAYAAYHRDRRNIVTHFFGVPLIVFAIILALATVSIPVGALAISWAAVLSIALCVYYVRLDLVLGVAMAAVLFLMCAGASEITARTTNAGALLGAATIFTLGWALQFLGHKFEGLKPAFFEDLMQLIIGPLFVCAEIFFLLGAKSELRRRIEERVGPTVARRIHSPATR
ncbi:MAG TPA: Mpo1-like protein [Usitatibacter sp.]|nr:Mpo1-like protein [Usitatibacter sp.]